MYRIYYSRSSFYVTCSNLTLSKFHIKRCRGKKFWRVRSLFFFRKECRKKGAIWETFFFVPKVGIQLYSWKKKSVYKGWKQNFMPIPRVLFRMWIDILRRSLYPSNFILFFFAITPLRGKKKKEEKLSDIDIFFFVFSLLYVKSSRRQAKDSNLTLNTRRWKRKSPLKSFSNLIDDHFLRLLYPYYARYYACL